MVDVFSSYAALSGQFALGRDYTITYVAGVATDFLIAGIHGGKIEFLTSQIAREIAGERYGLYLFEGHLVTHNSHLHLTSRVFDEPECLRLVPEYESVITIHGCSNKQADAVCLGGLHTKLILALRSALTENGVPCIIDGHPFPADSVDNICNKGKSGGVQIEIPFSFRIDPEIRGCIATTVQEQLQRFSREPGLEGKIL